MNYLIGLFFTIYFTYWFIFYYQILRYEANESSKNDKRADVLICLKNESQNIDSLVSHLDHQSCNVIYVDDFSNDDTYEKLLSHNKIVIKPDIDRLGKKAAISKGIQTSSADYILVADADCRMDPEWSTKMLSYICDKDILLGYGPMHKLPGIVPLFSRYETYHTAVQYFSYAMCGQAYMGVGRNMMVKRSEAIKAVPHLLASELSSGDDDMLVNYLAKSDNVAITLDPQTFVYSAPKESVKSFVRQKSRHISTSTTYKPLHQYLLGVYSMSYMGFYTLLLIGVAFGILSLKTFLFWLVGKWFLQSIINWKWMKKLKEFDLWWKFPILDMMMYLYLVILSPYLVFKNKSNWS